MLSNITSFSGNGLKDWLWQRISALLIGAYAVCLLGFFIKHPQIDYPTWVALFQCNVFKYFSILTLFSFVIHAWIGLWTISTDYLKCVCIRLTAQVSMIIFFVLILIWGFDIFWSI